MNRMVVSGRRSLCEDTQVPLQRLGEIRGEAMKSLRSFAGTLCLAVVWVLVLPKASALALASQVPNTGSSMTVPIMLAVVALCLVVGVGLRAFSKPAGELSLNQRTK
jgi:hypothetical protein